MFITEDKMETESQYLQKVGVVLSGTMSHESLSDARKAPSAKGMSKDVNFRLKESQPKQ